MNLICASLNNKKNIFDVRKSTESNATSVLDFSAQNESLQRKADIANCAVQRVVQRETGVVQRAPADGKFVYVKYNGNEGVSNASNQIHFSEYQNGGTKSIAFSGCLMMAFRFTKNKEDLKNAQIIYNDEDMKNVNINQTFIAHAYCSSGVDDTKEALYDAEKRGLIVIDALFKPKTPDDCKKIDEKKAAGFYHDCFTGKLNIESNFMSAEVFAEFKNVYEKIKKLYPQRDDASIRLKYINSNDLVFETFATKAFVYASVIARKDKDNNINVTAKDNDVKINAKKLDSDAWNYLEDFASADKKIIQRAMSLVKENSKEHKILKASTINE